MMSPYVPTGQSLHSFAPDVLLYVPIPQSRHVATVELYVCFPGGQIPHPTEELVAPSIKPNFPFVHEFGHAMETFVASIMLPNLPRGQNLHVLGDVCAIPASE